MLQIRQYIPSDHDNWIKCHLDSYYNSVYFDQLLKIKPRYETISVELVGTINDEIVGILDIEVESKPGQLCLEQKKRSGIISVIGVQKAHRRKGIATKLVETGIELILQDYNVHRLEIKIRNELITTIWLESLDFKNKVNFYEVTLTTDFFEKFNIDLPFDLMPDQFRAYIESENFDCLTKIHPPEQTHSIIIFEKEY